MRNKQRRKMNKNLQEVNAQVLLHPMFLELKPEAPLPADSDEEEKEDEEIVRKVKRKQKKQKASN